MLHFIDVFGQQPFGQRQDIGSAFAKWTPGQGENRQTVKKVFTEPPRRHLARQIAVGGGDHANIQSNRFTCPDALDLALLQHTQQFGLQAEGHFGDFVEQQRATVGLFELAGLCGNGARERTLLVAEQRGFEHVVRDRRAVNRDERLTGAMGLLMNVTRQHFFTGAGFARDQHRGIAARHPRCQLQQLRTGRLDGHRTVAVACTNTA
ncbi:hypothetical protein D3C72_896930 [compost metagenome]